MQNRVYSQQFDDIYFSPENGLAESAFVFLRGNDLPQRWRGRAAFTICETGFGTGLNFFQTCRKFIETASEGAQLHYVSFEKYPLSRDEIAEALSCWSDELSPYLDRFLKVYPLRVPGFHRVRVADNIFLTLVFDDINESMPELIAPRGIDAWFLDGFAPSKNPDMWTGTLFAQMARLSAPEATFATFTAAGFVKRGLQEAGFDVRKEEGFGRKRERLVGAYAGEAKSVRQAIQKPRVAVIGGGLAGTACAYVLRGLAEVSIFEASDDLAAGASGNRQGLCNPRFSAFFDENGQFYTAAFAQAVRTFSQIEGIDYLPSGTLHLITDENKDKRFKALYENWGWHKDHMALLSPQEASDIAGIAIESEALYLPDSCSVNPRKLCHTYAKDADMRLNMPVTTLERYDGQWLVNGERFDAVILACGAGVQNINGLDWLPVYSVRGQVSFAPETAYSQNLKCNICYSGYISAPRNGVHTLGSTFQRRRDDMDVTAEDHKDNLVRCAEHLPALAAAMKPEDGWAGLRTSSQDYFPLVGRVPDADGWRDGEKKNMPDLYISTAHGSHGLVSSLAGAQMIADMLMACPASQSSTALEALDSGRFLRRAAKKAML